MRASWNGRRASSRSTARGSIACSPPTSAAHSCAHARPCAGCPPREAARAAAGGGGGGGRDRDGLVGWGAAGGAGEYVDYAASKAALDALTIGLAREVAAEGIRVNSVRPGIIHSDIHADGGEPGRVDRLGPTLPMKRGGETIEVARAILWLVSEEASYSTGAFVDVAGGR